MTRDSTENLSKQSHTRWYAEQLGWQLSRLTVVVEGTSDVSYFRLAGRLYQKQHGRTLLNHNVTVVAAGHGARGGTHTIMEEFPVLRKILDMEKQCGIPQLVTLVTLLDDDDAGRKAREYITRRNHNLSKYRDVFLLKRCMPLDTKNPKDLELSTKNCNRPWEFLDCEIEDLINREVVDCFVFENPGCLSRNIQEFNGAFHCDFTVAGKSKFCRFVNEFARLEDLSGIISVLKAMRYYMGFEVDGDINS